MAVVAPARSIAPEVAGGRRASAVVVLARVEGRRILLHRAFLSSVGLAAAVIAVSALTPSGPIRGAEYGWRASIVAVASLVAIGAVLASNAAARRERSSGTAELFDASPTTGTQRTTALLLSSIWPTTVAFVVVAVPVTFGRHGDPFEASDVLKLAQVPLVVAGFSMLGTTLGRMTTTPATAVFASTLAFFLPFPADGERSLDWLAPFASWGWTSLPSLAWHAVYLAGGVVAVASLALIVTGARSRAWFALAIAIVAIVVAGTIQLPTGCQDVDLVGKVCAF